MITEVYSIEGHYLYTLVGSSGRGERTSERGATGAPERRAGLSEVRSPLPLDPTSVYK